MKKGFTLIELLVVVLIIGILAAVALPQYQKSVKKSRLAEVWTNLSALQKAYQLCKLENDTSSADDGYCGDLNNLSLSFTPGQDFSYFIMTPQLTPEVFAAAKDWKGGFGLTPEGHKHCYNWGTDFCKEYGFTKLSSSTCYYAGSCYTE